MVEEVVAQIALLAAKEEVIHGEIVVVIVAEDAMEGEVDHLRRASLEVETELGHSTVEAKPGQTPGSRCLGKDTGCSQTADSQTSATRTVA